MTSLDPAREPKPKKRLVVCCDGTWNSADLKTNETNVARLARAIHGSQQVDLTFQIVLYLRGVGTTGLKVGDVIEGAIGFGIDENIRSAYQFIAQNYLPGDEIFVFGFSRGAFTARSLAGLITSCGILKRQALGSLSDAWDYYRTDKPHSPVEFAKRYKTDNHEDVTITFLGVWDTVGSLGIPGGLFADANKKKFAFHDTSPSPIVKTACHAMAVDEHRSTFTPTYWTGEAPKGTSIEQVWFAGVHADVGGGYADTTLADIPLLWIAKRASEAGLAIDWSCLPDATNSLAPAHDSSSGLFAIDRYYPTLREIGGQQCNVSFNESLYTALDGNGKPIKTINERVHQSVLDRYGKQVNIASDDDKTYSSEIYQPKTLTPFYNSGVFSGLHIVE